MLHSAHGATAPPADTHQLDVREAARQRADLLSAHRTPLSGQPLMLETLDRRAQATDSKCSFSPSALETFMTVAKVGLPSAERAL